MNFYHKHLLPGQSILRFFVFSRQRSGQKLLDGRPERWPVRI